jgi:hypothetical protein
MRLSATIKPIFEPVVEPIAEGTANQHLLDVVEGHGLDDMYNTALDELKKSRPDLWKKIMRWD